MLKIAVSSRTLFDIEEGHQVWLEQGHDVFTNYMIDTENVPLKPGVAFPLIKKLLALNTPGESPLVQVAILSRNSPASGLRVMNSIRHYDLAIEQAAFTCGRDRFGYAKAMKVDLFITGHHADAEASLQNGVPAAVFFTGQARDNEYRDELRVAFDGDSVIFSDESDAVFRAGGLQAFMNFEKSREGIPMQDGPFKTVLEKMHALRTACPGMVRIALVTARDVLSHSRVTTTLRSWGIEMDEMVLCAGATTGTVKGEVLKAFGADLFFDDTQKHVESGHAHGVLSGYVPKGVGGIGQDPVIEIAA